MIGSPVPTDISSVQADSRPRSASAVRARIDAHPVSGSPAEMRAAFSRLTGPAPALGREMLGRVPAARVGTGPRRALWFHGGGYVFGAPETHAYAATHLADEARATVWLPDYPLAPEAPWPAQIVTARAALDAFPDPVALIGDSAGGHLALRLALERPGQVASLTLISPNTDRSGTAATRGSARDLMNDDATDNALAHLAFGPRDGRKPELSPWLDDLSVLPPTLILAASSEVLLDDSLLLARAAAQAAAPVSLRIWPGLFHLWPLWPEALPEAREALAAAAAHVAAHPG